MGLEKAMEHNKEHRKPFVKETGTYAKSIDCTCRNHGGCDWCFGNRIHKNQKRELSNRQMLKEREVDNNNDIN